MKIKLLAICIGIQIALILVDSTGVLRGVRSRMEIALLPFQQMSRETMQSVERSVRFLVSFGNVFEENENLQHELVTLREQVALIPAFEQEITALEQQVGTPVTKNHSLIPTKVIAFDRENDALGMILNVGSAQGVKVGDAVVLGQSLIGSISEISPNLSLVLPVIATQSIVPVYVQDGAGNRVNGVVHGEFNTGMVLSQFVREKPLESSEYAFSSGLDGKYPSGLLVGKVSQVTSAKANLFQEALLTPLWDIAVLDVVFVYPVRIE